MPEEFKPEDPANVGFVHADCAPKPDSKLIALPAKDFVGNYIKTAFPGVDPHGVKRIEHMWVMIKSVVDDETVRGVVENDAALEGAPAYGTEVDVKISSISQMMPEEK